MQWSPNSRCIAHAEQGASKRSPVHTENSTVDSDLSRAHFHFLYIILNIQFHLSAPIHPQATHTPDSYLHRQPHTRINHGSLSRQHLGENPLPQRGPRLPSRWRETNCYCLNCGPSQQYYSLETDFSIDCPFDVCFMNIYLHSAS